MNKYLIIGCLLLCCIPSAVADVKYYEDEVYLAGSTSTSIRSNISYMYFPETNATVYGTIIVNGGGFHITHWGGGGLAAGITTLFTEKIYYPNSYTHSYVYHLTSTPEYTRIYVNSYKWSPGDCSHKITVIASNDSMTSHYINGSLECVSELSLDVYDGAGWLNVYNNSSPGAYYNYSVMEGREYRLTFNSFIYQFTALASDTIYNYDGCEYCKIYLKDNCGNMMQNTSCDIYKSDGGVPASYEFVDNYWNTNPINLLVSDIGEGKMLDIYFDTDQGEYHQIDYCEEKIIDVLHPTKWWAINFGAFNTTTHNPIPDMKMHVNQSCKPDPEKLLRTYAYSGADGYAMFTGLSAQKVYIRMDNDVYQGDRFWVGGLGDAFGTYYKIDTYLDMSGDPDWGNGTENLSAECNIYFKDNSSIITNHIEDTDEYVDLYYQNGNCTATLKFQRLYSTYWMTKESYNIPINETGYKRLLNSNFSTSGVGYRAIMTASECECNSTMQLYVTNETIEEEQHYENLTAYCSFKHQLGGGQVDYRSDVEISAFAFTNTSATLLNINLTLYEQTSEIATFQCDWADFAGATPKWVFVWTPPVSYDMGKNYTVKMTGYNGHLLDTDDVWTSDIRNNELTVTVTDNNGLPLSYCYVYLEGWGQAETGDSNVCTIGGLGDGEYQYQATKSGYTTQGWESVNFTGYDQSVTVVLQTAYSANTVRGVKLNDTEIKSIFLPMFFLLWILIIFGGFKYVSK